MENLDQEGSGVGCPPKSATKCGVKKLSRLSNNKLSRINARETFIFLIINKFYYRYQTMNDNLFQYELHKVTSW